MRRFGTALAGLALYLQLALASFGSLALAAQGEPADAFGGHALCLAGESGMPQPAVPAGDAPDAPAHDHLAFCCLWHPVPGVAPQATPAPLPVAYADITDDGTVVAAFIPGPHRGPVNARAPPPLA